MTATTTTNTQTTVCPRIITNTTTTNRTKANANSTATTYTPAATTKTTTTTPTTTETTELRWRRSVSRLIHLRSYLDQEGGRDRQVAAERVCLLTLFSFFRSYPILLLRSCLRPGYTLGSTSSDPGLQSSGQHVGSWFCPLGLQTDSNERSPLDYPQPLRRGLFCWYMVYLECPEEFDLFHAKIYQIDMFLSSKENKSVRQYMVLIVHSV